MNSNWVRQPSKNSVEVATLKALWTKTNNKRKFMVVVKGSTDRVARIAKRNIIDYDHTIDSYFLKHTLNKHRNDIIPLERSDYKKIPMIIKKPSNIRWRDGKVNSGKNKNGDSKMRAGVIKYEKSYKRGRLVYLEEIRKGRRELAAKTMYWQPKQQK